MDNVTSMAPGQPGIFSSKFFGNVIEHKTVEWSEEIVNKVQLDRVCKGPTEGNTNMLL